MSAEKPRNPWNRTDDRSFLKIYDTESGTISTVAVFEHLIEAPNWSPDGEYLVYNSKGHIWKLRLKDCSVEMIDTGYADDCNNDHVISADGKTLAVSHNTFEDGKSRIYILPFEGGVPRLVTPVSPSYLHGISPDGQTLAYCAERNGKYDIYIVPAEGGVETRLTDAPGLNDGSEFDSRGEYIWFNSCRTGLMQAWRMKSDGSEQQQMTFDENWNTWFPHISPDCTKVAMIAYKKGDVEAHEHLPHKNVELRLMNADGSDVRTITTLFGGQGTMNVNSWSPDSKRFAFVSFELKD